MSGVLTRESKFRIAAKPCSYLTHGMRTATHTFHCTYPLRAYLESIFLGLKGRRGSLTRSEMRHPIASRGSKRRGNCFGWLQTVELLLQPTLVIFLASCGHIASVKTHELSRAAESSSEVGGIMPPTFRGT